MGKRSNQNKKRSRRNNEDSSRNADGIVSNRAIENNNNNDWTWQLAVPLLVSSCLLAWFHGLGTLSLTENHSSSTSASTRMDGVSSSSSILSPAEQWEQSAMQNCRFVLAPARPQHAGWGIFATQPIIKGDAILGGGPVLQIVDLLPFNNEYAGLDYILHNYSYSASVTGGNVEAQTVYSLIPGVGSLANGHFAPGLVNAASRGDFPKYGSFGMPRNIHPANIKAGSATAYQNFTLQAQKHIPAGHEVIVRYGTAWADKLGILQATRQTVADLQRPVSWLRQHGHCLDHLQVAGPAAEHGGVGHGVQARHDIPAGATITVVPLLPLHRQALQRKTSGSSIQQQKHQLALNYMLGHSDSNLLLWPYGPWANLLNHYRQDDNDDENDNASMTMEPNAQLVWDNSLGEYQTWSQLSVHEILNRKRSGLVARLVALRDIRNGAAVVIDYGAAWQNAWNAHAARHAQAQHQQQPSQQPHAYAPTLEQRYPILPTPAEMNVPFPGHVQLVCAMNIDAPVRRMNDASSSSSSSSSSITVSTWDGTVTDVVPCTIQERHQSTPAQQSPSYYYTVRVYESPNALDSKFLNHANANEIRLVQGVPRQYIRFAERPYQSDQHLPQAFRHEMQALEFPPAWLDKGRF